MRPPFKAEPLSAAARDVRVQLFRQGPTWDGDLCSKEGKRELCRLGLATHHEGWTQLSDQGFADAVNDGFGDDKDRWDRDRRARA